MRNIVLRTGVNVYKDYLRQLESKVTVDCIKHLTQSNFTDHLQEFNTRPMFSRMYIVYADVEKLDQKYLTFLTTISSTKWVMLIIRVRSKDTFETLKFKKPFSDFTFLDCYGLSKEILDRYIISELRYNGCPESKITKAAVTRIRRRAKYKEYVLDSVIPILAQTDMTLKTINSYIEPYRGVTMQNIGSKLFLREKSAPVADFIYSHRMHITYVYKQVKDYLDMWFRLYEEFSDGKLSEDTLVKWLSESGKKYGISFDYQAKDWLASFSTYSYDFMLLAFLTLQESAHGNNSEQFLSIYRIYRMVNT